MRRNRINRLVWGFDRPGAVLSGLFAFGLGCAGASPSGPWIHPHSTDPIMLGHSDPKAFASRTSLAKLGGQTLASQNHENRSPAWRWRWLNPQPTGNHLIQVAFTAPDQGWIVADDGEVFRSEDGGNSWVSAGGGLGTNDMVAALVRSDFHLGVDNLGRIWGTPSKRVGWVRIDSVAGSLYDIRDCGGGTFLAVGDAGGIYKGGKAIGSWRRVHGAAGEGPLVGLSCGGDGWAVAVGEGGRALRSLDFGEHWDTLPKPMDQFLTGVAFLQGQKGLVVTAEGMAALTGDGGVTWTLSVVDPAYFLRHARWNGGELLVAGSDGGAWRSLDGGHTWIPFPKVTDHYLAMSARDGAGGEVFVGNAGTILTRREGDSSWVLGSRGSRRGVQGLSFLNNRTWLAYGFEGLILKTEDAGTTWRESTGNDRFLSAAFEGKRGILSGVDGTLSYTTDGGESWEVSAESPREGYLYGVAFQDSLKAMAVGQNGKAWRSWDGGVGWKAVSIDAEITDESLSAVGFSENGKGFIVGYRGLMLRSDDGGENWSRLSVPTSENLYGFTFRDADVGAAFGAHGTVLITRDGGDSWVVENTQASEDELFSAAWLGGDTLAVSGAWGHYSKIRLTANWGKSWTEVPPPTEMLVYSIASPSPGRLALTGQRGMVLIGEVKIPGVGPDGPRGHQIEGIRMTVHPLGSYGTARVDVEIPFSGDVTLTQTSLDGRRANILYRGALGFGSQTLTLRLPSLHGPALFLLELVGEGTRARGHAWLLP